MLGELLLGIKKSPAGTSSGENPGEGVSDTDSKNRLLQAFKFLTDVQMNMVITKWPTI